MLLVIIPLAVIKDFCCSQVPRKSKRFKNRVVSIFGCVCFGIIFIVDVFIFNTYFDKAALFDSQSAHKEEMDALNEDADVGASEQTYDQYVLMMMTQLVTLFGSMQSQLEFLTLTGVIFNALMQGYVCVNTIYQFLIENIYQSP